MSVYETCSQLLQPGQYELALIRTTPTVARAYQDRSPLEYSYSEVSRRADRILHEAGAGSLSKRRAPEQKVPRPVVGGAVPVGEADVGRCSSAGGTHQHGCIGRWRARSPATHAGRSLVSVASNHQYAVRPDGCVVRTRWGSRECH